MRHGKACSSPMMIPEFKLDTTISTRYHSSILQSSCRLNISGCELQLHQRKPVGLPQQLVQPRDSGRSRTCNSQLARRPAIPTPSLESSSHPPPNSFWSLEALLTTNSHDDVRSCRPLRPARRPAVLRRPPGLQRSAHLCHPGPGCPPPRRSVRR